MEWLTVEDWLTVDDWFIVLWIYLVVSYTYMIFHLHGFSVVMSGIIKYEYAGETEWDYWNKAHMNPIPSLIIFAPATMLYALYITTQEKGNPFYYCVHSNWFVNSIYFSPIILLSTLWLM